MLSDVWDMTKISEYEEDDDMSHFKIVLRRIPTAADWERCLFYSHRVKSFCVDEEHFLEPSDVYEILDSAFPEKPIFPNLQKLNWGPSTDPGSFRYVHLFITARLTDLGITFEHQSHLSVLPVLSSKCPGLMNVSIDTAKPVPAFSTFVCSLPHVETLVVSDLNTAALSHIARLPNLRYLWLMSFSPVPSFRSPAGFLPFPALNSLKYESIEHTPRLLELLIKPSLAELRIIARAIRFPPLKTLFQQFYGALATHCSHSSLQKISVGRGHWSVPADERDMYAIGGSILRPLFAFSNLVDVALSHPVGVDLDDDEVREMARAWPHIESLQLPPEPSHRITPRVTLKGMHAFAGHCHRLHTLHFVFDATVVPKIKGKANKNACQRSLESLNVAYSPISQPRSVAKFLSAIFPHLGTITTLQQRVSQSMADIEAIASQKCWEKVEEVLCDL
ncbi:hypothetical protein K438DRAFT_1974844 [Mycena galopus ATCC 62051]|nr:hypothetical protein K438DRAFT_1974844 [Mycena galopus ATCC 62051]